MCLERMLLSYFSLRGGKNISIYTSRIFKMGTEILNVMLNLNKLSRNLNLRTS